ncbi:MAG TPA: CdaR family protein [Candidatus Limnocylindrales bacterium]|nr:CdaR family protein [Candidatus Limnocylindrales bacterium]
MSRFLRVITYNWPLKLAAIALATLLYAGLVVSQSSFEFPGPVQIKTVNQPTDAVVLGNLPPVTRIRYVVSGDVGSPPTTDSFLATIDLKGVNPQAGSTYVTIDVVSVDRRFLVVDYEPRGVNVQLDPFTSKSVAVQVNMGDTPPNLDVREPVIDPATVTVSGPASVVTLVVAARADVAIDPSGTLVDRDVTLIPVDILGNALRPVRVTPTTSRIRIPVFTNSRKKSLVVNPNVIGTPPTGYEIASVVAEPVVVTVEANGDQLATLARADTQPIPIGAVTGTLDVDVGFALPAGVLPVGVDTVHVTVTIKPETGTKAFEAGLVMAGRQTGLNYDLSTGQVLVTLGGPLADLERLDASAFTVTLDVRGLTPGVHELEPVPNLQAGLRLLAVAPAKVTVTVTPVGSPTPAPSGS